MTGRVTASLCRVHAKAYGKLSLPTAGTQQSFPHVPLHDLCALTSPITSQPHPFYGPTWYSTTTDTSRTGAEGMLRMKGSTFPIQSIVATTSEFYKKFFRL